MRNNVRFMYVLCVLLMVCPHMATMRKCWAGTYVYKSGMCTECPDETVMPHEEHENTACLPCEKIRNPELEILVSPCNKTHQAVIHCVDGSYRNPGGTQTSCKLCEKIKEPELEILISPCNKTHDAVIHCVDGYYRDEARNPRETGQCKKCSQCRKFTGRPCGTYRDTVCCWDENYDVVPNHDGVPVCRERPWFCRRGQYFDTEAYYCLSCPENTFMPLEYHIQTQCWKCKTSKPYRPLHSVIIQPCNSTHAPVIRCKDGFFIKPNMGYRDDAVGCSPCTDCSTKTDVQYEGRKCDGMEDTVCCPQPNMTVIDTPEGPVCMASSASCGAGYCLLYHTTNGSSKCASCVNNADLGKPDSNLEDSANFSGDIKRASVSPNEAKVKKKTISACNDCWPDGLACGLYIAGVINGIIFTLIWKKLKSTFYGTWICGKIRCLTERCMRPHRYENVATEPQNEHDVEVKPPEGKSEELQRTTSLSDYNELEQSFGNETDLEANKGYENVATEPQNEHDVEVKPPEGKSEELQRTTSLSDYNELEHSFGNEIDLEGNKNTCFRREDHVNLICEEEFVLDTLPPDFRDKRYLAYIKAACQLTVRVRVYHISYDRPENDPYYALRGLAGIGLRRFGNGLLYQLSEKFDKSNNRNCPCKDCQAFPEKAKKDWAEFLVVTSAQIVFDETECSNTSCKLWYDRDVDDRDVDPSKIPSLKGWKVKMIDREKDVCIMQCVSHNPEVTKNLEKKVLNFNEFHDQNPQAADDVDGANRHAVIISHPHGLNKRISQRKAQAEDVQVRKWTFDELTCPGSLGAPVCLLSSKPGSKIITTIYNGNRESRGFDLDDVEMLSFNNNHVKLAEKRNSASLEVDLEPRSSTSKENAQY